MWWLGLVLYFIITMCCYSEQRATDDRYSAHMNGGSNAPPWPGSNFQNGTMFAVPTQLKEPVEIIVKGNMANGMLDIALRPDGGEYNIVCQLNVVYPDNGAPHNQIIIRNVENGNVNTFSDSNTATQFFNDGSFDIHFVISSSLIRIYERQSNIESIPLQHSMDDIRFISVRGEVKELGFVFNS